MTSEHILYYLHGGGFYTGSSESCRQFSFRLAQAARAKAMTIDYRLAPEHPFPAALEDSLAAYRWLLENNFRPENIIIGGDSAGGNLALATLVALRDAGDPLPAAAFCMSPALDMLLSGESLTTHASLDPIFTRAYFEWAAPLYIGEGDPRNPLMSPLYADLRGLPPLLIHVGSHELMLSDSTRLAENAQEAGVDVTLKIWEEMFHVFQVFSFLPEARQAVREIGDFARQHLGLGITAERALGKR